MCSIVFEKAKGRDGTVNRPSVYEEVILTKRHLQDVLRMSYQEKYDILPKHLADVQKMS